MKVVIALLTLLSAQAVLADCTVDITVGDTLKFSKDAIEVKQSCANVTIRLTHSGALPAGAMGHNWVLTRSKDYEAVARAGASSGLSGNFLPADDERVIAATPVIGGGNSTSVTFSLDELDRDADYTFFCSFPGHWAVMNGPFEIS